METKTLCDFCANYSLGVASSCKKCKKYKNSCVDHAPSADLCYDCFGFQERLVRTCLNCGSILDDAKCKLVCSCGYFASCSDYF